MKATFYRLMARVMGRNSADTPTEVIADQLLEPRPLPMGRQEFEEWSDRIIAGAMIPLSPDLQDVGTDSLKWTLANTIMHLGPTESHKPDAYFIHALRKLAANQVADTLRREFHEKGKARLAAQEAAEKAKAGADEVLANANVPRA